VKPLNTQQIRFWWVNQNQTYKQEISGGYLWSPKRNSRGGRNPFYEFMREVSPGDILFSFNVGSFSDGQKEYLEFHREHVFLEARVSTQ